MTDKETDAKFEKYLRRLYKVPIEELEWFCDWTLQMRDLVQSIITLREAGVK